MCLSDFNWFSFPLLEVFVVDTLAVDEQAKRKEKKSGRGSINWPWDQTPYFFK